MHMWSWRMRNQQLEGHEGFLDREESMWEDAQMDMEAAGYVCEQWTTGRSFLRWLKWKICLKWRHWGGSLFSLSDLSFVLRVSRHPCNVLVDHLSLELRGDRTGKERRDPSQERDGFARQEEERHLTNERGGMNQGHMPSSAGTYTY